MTIRKYSQHAEEQNVLNMLNCWKSRNNSLTFQWWASNFSWKDDAYFVFKRKRKQFQYFVDTVGLIHFQFPNESESNFEICRESGDLGILHLATHHHAPPHTRVVSIFYNPTICPPPVLFGAWRLKSNFCNLSASYLLQFHQILCTCSSRRMTCKSCCRRWNECNKCKKFSLRANGFSEGNKGYCRLKCT